MEASFVENAVALDAFPNKFGRNVGAQPIPIGSSKGVSFWQSSIFIP